jgi:hypothetical protein
MERFTKQLNFGITPSMFRRIGQYRQANGGMGLGVACRQLLNNALTAAGFPAPVEGEN